MIHKTVFLVISITKKLSNFTIEYLTDVSLYKLPYSKLRAILKRDVELSSLYTDTLHHFFVTMEENEREKSLWSQRRGI